MRTNVNQVLKNQCTSHSTKQEGWRRPISDPQNWHFKSQSEKRISMQSRNIQPINRALGHLEFSPTFEILPNTNQRNGSSSIRLVYKNERLCLQALMIIGHFYANFSISSTSCCFLVFTFLNSSGWFYEVSKADPLTERDLEHPIHMTKYFFLNVIIKIHEK